MASTGDVIRARAPNTPRASAVPLVRLVIVLGLLLAWEAVARSGILLREVAPSLVTIGQSLWELLFQPSMTVSGFGASLRIPAIYWHLYVTLGEMVAALAIGCSAGLVVGLLLGANPFLSRAFERYLAARSTVT